MTERHAITRARERYGLDLTLSDLEDIARTLRQAGVLVANQRDGTSVWLVRVKTTVCRVVVSKAGYVRTFLPPNARLGKARL